MREGISYMSWQPIETAPENQYIVVTGNHMVGDPPDGRYYARAIKRDGIFCAIDDHGDEYEPGFLTLWTHEPQ
jgi:hypothetical protein